MAPYHSGRPKPVLWCFLALTAVVLAFTILAPSVPDRTSRFNVILISLDTVRADHLGCYGHPFVETPHIDALAAGGVRFTDVTAAAPTTLASHTSIMTGTYPHTHGVPRNGFVIHPDNRMLAEILREAGFTTAGFLGSFALESRFGFNQGFQHFDETFDLQTATDGVDQNQRCAERVTDAVLKFLDRAGGEQRFMFVHYFDAHAPYAPPPPFDARYAQWQAAASGSLVEVEQAVQGHRAALGESGGQPRVLAEGLTTETVRGATGEPLGLDAALDARYGGEITYVDREVGRLIAELKRRGLYEESLIVLTSDHGETMWEHGDFWNHGLWVYDTTVRVPLIVRRPGGEDAGRVVTHPVSTLDIMPTVLALAGVAAPEGIEGASLILALRGEAFERGELFSEATQPYSGIESAEGWRNAMKPKCVRSGRWKYIVAPYLRLEELYDLEGDPGERRNLLAGPPEVGEAWHRAAEFRGLVKAWHQSAKPLPSKFDATHHEETVRRLRSLGYVGEIETPQGTDAETP